MEIQEKYMHKANFLSTSTLFSAVFNVPTPGRYDFAETPACQNVPVMALLPGTVYWIKRLSVGGNIPEEDYSGSIEVFPAITIRRQQRPEPVYRFPVPINKYIDSGNCEAWIVNDRINDQLTLSLSGRCVQLPTMVGVTTLTLSVSFQIYGINDQGFMSEFRSRVK